MKEIRVIDVLGGKLEPEDGIIVREMVEKFKDKNVTLNFENIDKVPSTFLSNLFTDIINKYGRDYVLARVNVKNLSNFRNYNRVVAGTTFVD